jgi:RNA recognition motif-containing protein
MESIDLKKLFNPYGLIASISIVTDKFTNRSRGFGYVRIDDNEAAEKAILELNGTRLNGRSIKMKEAVETDLEYSLHA